MHCFVERFDIRVGYFSRDNGDISDMKTMARSGVNNRLSIGLIARLAVRPIDDDRAEPLACRDADILRVDLRRNRQVWGDGLDVHGANPPYSILKAR